MGGSKTGIQVLPHSGCTCRFAIVVYQEKGGETPGSTNRPADNGTQDPAKVDLLF